MTDYLKELYELNPTREYLVAIDSDGCVFDAMGIKQRECFCPMMIAYFGLQPVAEAARECKEFADLFSITRGANRHKTIVRILTELLPNHPMVQNRSFQVPQLPHYVKWVTDPSSLLSEEGLKHMTEASEGQAKKEFETVFQWSVRVNELVAEIVKDIPPFPYARESLSKIVEYADIIVCSSTPVEALSREWSEHDIEKYALFIAGQEMGSKAKHLSVMAEKYKPNKILMMGDAISDQHAAEINHVMFYPINPGNEAESWKRFYDEAFEKFLNNTYASDYQTKLKKEFCNYLPDTPSWMKK